MRTITWQCASAGAIGIGLGVLVGKATFDDLTWHGAQSGDGNGGSPDSLEISQPSAPESVLDAMRSARNADSQVDHELDLGESLGDLPLDPLAEDVLSLPLEMFAQTHLHPIRIDELKGVVVLSQEWLDAFDLMNGVAARLNDAISRLADEYKSLDLEHLTVLEDSETRTVIDVRPPGGELSQAIRSAFEAELERLLGASGASIFLKVAAGDLDRITYGWGTVARRVTFQPEKDGTISIRCTANGQTSGRSHSESPGFLMEHLVRFESGRED